MHNPSNGEGRRGPPRILKEPAARTYYLELRLAQAVEHEAQRRGVSQSYVVREILTEVYPDA